MQYTAPVASTALSGRESKLKPRYQERQGSVVCFFNTYDSQDACSKAAEAPGFALNATLTISIRISLAGTECQNCFHQMPQRPINVVRDYKTPCFSHRRRAAMHKISVGPHSASSISRAGCSIPLQNAARGGFLSHRNGPCRQCFDRAPYADGVLAPVPRIHPRRPDHRIL